MVAKHVPLPIFRVEQPKVTRSEIRRVRWLGDDRNAFWQGIAAQQAMCGLVHYRDAETTLPATCHAVSTELHHVTSVKLACRNDH